MSTCANTPSRGRDLPRPTISAESSTTLHRERGRGDRPCLARSADPQSPNVIAVGRDDARRAPKLSGARWQGFDAAGSHATRHRLRTHAADLFLRPHQLARIPVYRSPAANPRITTGFKMVLGGQGPLRPDDGTCAGASPTAT